MDKVAEYQHVICTLLKEYAGIKKSLMPNVKNQMMVDKENHHYQLLSIGWHRDRFVYTVAFHFDIIDPKIWIQQNNTDRLIADELCEMGIPKSDIVLGFLQEAVRIHTGFAQR
jgi:XisI protein